MKKSILVLCFVMCALLCGCNDSDSSDSKSSSKADSSSAAISSDSEVSSTIDVSSENDTTTTTSVSEQETDSGSETEKTTTNVKETETSTKKETTTTVEKTTSDDSLDYDNEVDFEKDLKNKVDVVGKTVKFVAKEIKPQSIYGYNVWAGEHLNFVSSDNMNIEVGEEVIVKVTSTKCVMSNSWIIRYELIGKDKASIATDNESDTNNKTYTAEEFESAENEGKDLTGCIVEFVVKSVHPDSKFGYNLTSGEHLNFIFEKDQGANVGDKYKVKVLGIKCFMGSWIIAAEPVV